ELKALRMHPAWSGQVCRASITLLLRYGYIPAPHTIYQGIYKLPPGSWLSLTAADLGDGLSATGGRGPKSYWSVREVAEAGLANPWPGSPTEAVDAVERQLSATVQEQMVADVPLGAFLSGGID